MSRNAIEHPTLCLFVLASSLALLASACSDPRADLPSHTTEISSLEPKAGKRVQVNVVSDISREECLALIEAYRGEGAPDGQVSVHKPSTLPVLRGHSVPWCVENFDGKGIYFNDVYHSDK